MSIRLYPHRVEIATDEAIVARHVRLPGDGRIGYDWQHYRRAGAGESPVRCVTGLRLPTCRSR